MPARKSSKNSESESEPEPEPESESESESALASVSGSKVGAVLQRCNSVLEGCVRSLLPEAWVQRIGQQTQSDGQVSTSGKANDFSQQSSVGSIQSQYSRASIWQQLTELSALGTTVSSFCSSSNSSACNSSLSQPVIPASAAKTSCSCTCS